ncbi:cytochrome P450 [Modestobacter sp. VKM Ac-2984]|uniref:cytochrome P450 n=1 Tax=Modestobacter sp. VKM Ac-2984 TaxID=3004138 RepID=UPI0022AA7B28|nr:cytochrome P450 [Modestobacter sp. VKM Ac-2984]MCZ2816300.1 cytochrome P450 [Modestobacter sp. VKM Ac-2984]
MSTTDFSPPRPGRRRLRRPVALTDRPATRGSRRRPRRQRSARALAQAWLGRLVERRVRRKGIDLTELTFFPESARLPLLRNGVDPVPELAEQRARCPVARLDLPMGLAVHLVTGYEQARAVLTDRDSYSNDIRHLFRDAGPGSTADVGGLGFTDPPVHTRLRKLVAPEFTRRRLDRLEPTVQAIVDRRLDELAAAGSPADLAEHVSWRVPMDVICGLLGLDDADHEAFVRLGTQRFDATGGAAAALGAVSEQKRILLDVVARQRLAPGDGLIGRILQAEGDGISDDDLAGLVDGIVTGGYETTASSISLGTMVLLRDPAHAALVRDGSPADVDGLVEELLRHLSVVQVAFPRFAKQDLELSGCPVRQGDLVAVSLSGADRDPAWAGSEPDRFQPGRSTDGGHLAFGHGMHRCVGAELARMELRIVLPALFRRFPDLAVAVPEEQLPWRGLSFVYGVEQLPVTF